jgi:hypothetical protein
LVRRDEKEVILVIEGRSVNRTLEQAAFRNRLQALTSVPGEPR